MDKRGTFSQLDGLRAIAALSVFIHHIFQQQFESGGDDFCSCILRHLGDWGVAVFFALSGFCIHWSRLKHAERSGTFSRTDYFRRRFLRIYPAFALCIIVSLTLANVRPSALISPATPIAVAAHLLALSNFFPAYRTAFNCVIWSVVLELHFYLLYGLFAPQFANIHAVRRSALFAVAVAAIAYFLSVTLLGPGDDRVTLQHTAFSSFWTWCLGVLVAEQLHSKLHPRTFINAPTTSWLIWCGTFAIGLLPASISLQFQRFCLPLLIALGLYLVLSKPNALLSSPPLRWIGKVSYSLYLFHPVAIWLFVGSELPAWLNVAVTVVIGIAMAAVAYRLVELPFQAAKSNAQTTFA